MTSQREKDILLDQVLNNQIPKDALDEDSASLIGVASQLQAFLEETPPPPHGLKPGRSAFLTAAAQQPEKSKRFLFFPFPLPRLSRAAAWVMPFAAIFVLAILLGTAIFTTGGYNRQSLPATTTIPSIKSVPEPENNPVRSPSLLKQTDAPPVFSMIPADHRSSNRRQKMI